MSTSVALPKSETPSLENFDTTSFRSTAYFGPDQLEDFAAYAAKVESFEDVDFATNIPTNSEGELSPSEGFVLALVPVLRRANKEKKEEGFQLDRVVLAQLPAVETLIAKPDFADYVYSSVFSSLENKLTTALKQETQLPSAIADFVISGRKTADITWKEIGADVVKALRAKGIPVDSAKALRSILSSKSYAVAMAPNTSQNVWEKVTDLCIKLAEQRGLSTEVLEHWAATRDETDLTMNVSEDALSELEGLLGNDDSSDPDPNDHSELA